MKPRYRNRWSGRARPRRVFLNIHGGFTSLCLMRDLLKMPSVRCARLARTLSCLLGVMAGCGSAVGGAVDVDLRVESLAKPTPVLSTCHARLQANVPDAPYPAVLTLFDAAQREEVARSFRARTGMPWPNAAVSEFGLVSSAWISYSSDTPNLRGLPSDAQSDADVHRFWFELLQNDAQFWGVPALNANIACEPDAQLDFVWTQGGGHNAQHVRVSWSRKKPGLDSANSVSVEGSAYPFFVLPEMLSQAQLDAKLPALFGTRRLRVREPRFHPCDCVSPDCSECTGVNDKANEQYARDDAAFKAAVARGLKPVERIQISSYSWHKQAIVLEEPDGRSVTLRIMATPNTPVVPLPPEAGSLTLEVDFQLEPKHQFPPHFAIDAITGEDLSSVRCSDDYLAGTLRVCSASTK